MPPSVLRSRHSPASIAAYRAFLLGFVAAVVAGCGHQPPTSAASVVTGTPRAASETAAEAAASLPAGWQTFEDDTGWLRLSLPPDLHRIEGFPGVSAQLAAEPPSFAIEVHASAAPELQPPEPWTQSAVEAWLLERAAQWVGAGDITHLETLRVQLPAGEAIRVRAELHPGNPDVIEVAAFAVPTARGVADLHILALPEYWESRGDDLELIPRLLEIGD